MDERSAQRVHDAGKPASGRRLLSMWLRPLDTYLRRRLGILEYTQAPDCMFRIQVVTNDEDVLLVDGTRLRVGDRLIELHFWNEHVPPMPDEGATMAWARLISRRFNTSMRELALYLAGRRDLDDVRGIRAIMSSDVKKQAERLVRIVNRYGFEWIPSRAPENLGQRAHRYGENILVAALIRAHNPKATREGTLRRGRIPIYLSRRMLDRRYGKPGAISATNSPSAKPLSPHKIPRSKASF